MAHFQMILAHATKLGCAYKLSNVEGNNDGMLLEMKCLYDERFVMWNSPSEKRAECCLPGIRVDIPIRKEILVKKTATAQRTLFQLATKNITSVRRSKGNFYGLPSTFSIEIVLHRKIKAFFAFFPATSTTPLDKAPSRQDLSRPRCKHLRKFLRKFSINLSAFCRSTDLQWSLL